MLEARQLALWRGATHLFTDLSFLVQPGAALLLRGANGTGKTSLLRVLAGLTLPEEGEISWQGKRCASGLRGAAAYNGHHSALNVELTVMRNLVFYARLDEWHGEFMPMLDRLGLTAIADLEVRHLSAGQRRRAALARLLISDRPVWLLDEPFTNLDVDGRMLVEECISEHLANGGLVVAAAHEQMTFGSHPFETLRMGVD